MSSEPRLRVWYTLGELADLCGRSKRQLRRLLDKNDIRTHRLGQKEIVFLATVENALPELFFSILSAQNKRAYM